MNQNGEELQISYLRDETVYASSIVPVKTEDNDYKLGLWVRDAASGVGTMTFYDPSKGTYCALGHGIVDNDTGNLIDIEKGKLVTSNIVSIKKGEIGNPR